MTLRRYHDAGARAAGTTDDESRTYYLSDLTAIIIPDPRMPRYTLRFRTAPSADAKKGKKVRVLLLGLDANAPRYSCRPPNP